MKLFLVVLLTAIAAVAAVAAASEADFRAAMKKMGPTTGSLRKSVEAKDAEAVKTDAAALEAIFKTSEEFWMAREAQDAIDLSAQGKAGAAEIARLAAAGEWEKIPDAAKKVQSTCGSCHAVHREKLPDGGNNIK